MQTNRHTQANEAFDAALTADEAGELVKAIDGYRRALDIKPSHVEALINLGTALCTADMPEAALVQYRRAVMVDPSNPIAWFNLGASAHDLGKVSMAKTAYKRALQLAPGMNDARCNLAALTQNRRQAGRR